MTALSLGLLSWPGLAALGAAGAAGGAIAYAKPVAAAIRAHVRPRCDVCGNRLVGPYGGRYCRFWLLHLARVEVRAWWHEATERHPAKPAPELYDWDRQGFN